MGYLVISRRIGERIQIGEDIEILLADVHEGKDGIAGKADIAIKAPKSMAIIRKKNHIFEEKENVSSSVDRRPTNKKT